jgi:hypothetical protein
VGEGSIALFFMNIAGTSVALAQEYLDHLMSLQQRYYVEMSNNLIISKESDQEAQKLVVNLDHETKHAPSQSQIITNLTQYLVFPTCCHFHICLQEKLRVGNH